MILDPANDTTRPRSLSLDSATVAPILSANDNDSWRAITGSSSANAQVAPLEIVDDTESGGDDDNPNGELYLVAHRVRPEPWDSTNPAHLHRDGTDFEMRGDLQSAQRCFQQLISVHEEQIRSGQGQPLQLAQSLDDLARVYQRQGNNQAAEPLLTRALELNREHRQGNDPQLGFSMTRLGELFEATARPQQATQLYQDSVETFERHNNPNLLREARIRLGLNYQTIGNQGESIRTFQQVIDSSPANSVQQAEGRALLSLSLARNFQRQEADQALQQALDFRTRNGSNLELDRALIHTLQGLADLDRPNKKLGTGDMQSVINRLEQADNIARQRYGEQSPDFARVRARLGMARTDNGDHAWGLALLQQSLAIQEQRLGEAHPDTMATRQAMIDNMISSNNPAGAEQLARRHMEVIERARGANHPDVASAARQVGSAASLAGNPGVALAMAHRTANILQQHRAERPGEYAYAMAHLAHLQMENNLPVDALITSTRMAEFARANLANEPMLLSKILSTHIATLRANGKDNEAERIENELNGLMQLKRR